MFVETGICPPSLRDRSSRTPRRASCCARLVLLAALTASLASCAGRDVYSPRHSTTGTYVVRAGDTLYGIAFRHGLDYRELAAWNGLSDPGLIFPGQTLRVLPLPAETASASTGRASAPDAGPSGGSGPAVRPRPQAAPARPASPTGPPSTTGARGENESSSTQSAPPQRLAWRWPADGVLLARFGDAGSLGKGIDIGGRQGDPVRASAPGRVVYAGSGLIGYGKLIIVKHNENYLSAYGHNKALLVKQGDEVTVGQRVALMGRGPGNKPLLHFEIRLNGKPVDPLHFLPNRK